MVDGKPAFSSTSWGVLSPLARCYALMLWRHWGACGRACWESLPTLARRMLVHERSLRRMEAQLEAAGVLVRHLEPRRRSLAFQPAFEAWLDELSECSEGGPTSPPTRTERSPSPGPVSPPTAGARGRRTDQSPSPGPTGPPTRTGESPLPGPVGPPREKKREREQERTKPVLAPLGRVGGEEEPPKGPIPAKPKGPAWYRSALSWPLPPGLDLPQVRQAWEGWVEARRLKGAKGVMSERACELAVAKLAEWGPELAVEALDKANMSGWVGIFDPRENPWGKAKGEDYEDALAEHDRAKETERYMRKLGFRP